MSSDAPVARPTFSFELFPPRDGAAEAALVGGALPALVAAGPEFISVTYGASGSTRGVSLDVLRRLLETSVKPMAHLTCVGSSYSEASRLIREFLDAGVTSFLALRGDPPTGVPEGEVFLGDLGSAGELVQLIHRVQAERVPFRQLDVPGVPQAKRLVGGEKVTARIYDRARLRAGDVVRGPAIVTEMDSTTLVLPGHAAEVHASGSLLINPSEG